MKKWPALIVTVTCLCFAGCDNGTGTSGNGTPFTGPTSIEEVIEYLADKKQDGSDPDNPVELAVRINMNEWRQLLDAIRQVDKFVALDISRCYNIPQEFLFVYGGVRNDKIVSLVLPSETTSIWHGMFYGSTNLRQVTLPANLTEIGAMAFGDCTDLKLVIFHAPAPPTMVPLQPAIPEGSEYLFYNTSPNLAIKVPAKSVAAYKAAWPTWANRIGPI